MICYAVVDTNVIVAALLSSRSDSATVQVVEKLLTGDIVPVFSKSIIREYREVLLRPKFGFSSQLVHYILTAIERFGIMVNPSPSGMILPDIKDLPFYEVALEKRDNAYLVTGNKKHFPNMPYVVTPRELLDIIANKSYAQEETSGRNAADTNRQSDKNSRQLQSSGPKESVLDTLRYLEIQTNRLDDEKQYKNRSNDDDWEH